MKQPKGIDIPEWFEKECRDFISWYKYKSDGPDCSEMADFVYLLLNDPKSYPSHDLIELKRKINEEIKQRLVANITAHFETK